MLKFVVLTVVTIPLPGSLRLSVTVPVVAPWCRLKVVWTRVKQLLLLLIRMVGAGWTLTCIIVSAIPGVGQKSFGVVANTSPEAVQQSMV